MTRSLALAVLLAYLPAAAPAKIFKLAIPSGPDLLLLYWWPMLPPMPGWHHDEAASERHGVNALVPDGQNFNHAPAIIYAKADEKSRMQGTATLAQFIAGDIASFQRQVRDERIAPLPPLRDGDGQMLPCYSFISKRQGSWEIVAYGEEGDFYLVFTVSAFDDAALEAARPAFIALVAQYRA